MKTKIIFLTNAVPFGFSYFSEDIAELEPETANDLISKKICKKLIEPYTPLPKISFRDELIRAGFYSMEILEKAQRDEVIDIGGTTTSVCSILEKYKKNNFFKNL